MTSTGDDCYFFYYSSCSKGALCPFRHEPAALENETVCSFWEKGMCLKPKCMFRHMKVEKKRNVIQCYWESQPGGCKKPHCSFLHDKPKDPYPEAVTALLQTTAKSKIIINKNKIAELGHLILPLAVKDGDVVGSTPDETAEPSKPVRLSAKLRIGSKPLAEATSAQGVKKRLGGVKSRLGLKLSNRVGSVVLDNNEKLEVFECSDDDEELDSEEEALRADAIKTIDLRKRLATKNQTSEDDNDVENAEDEDLQQVRSAVRVVPQVEKRKKEKKSKKKKKEKKSKRSKSPSEEFESTKSKRKVLAKSRKYHEEMINNEDEGDYKPSLADRIAAQRDLEHHFGGDGSIRNRVGRAEYHESDKRRTERERRESETRMIRRRDRSSDEIKSRKTSHKEELENLKIGRKSESEKETPKSPEERRKRRKSVETSEGEEAKASTVKRSKVTSDENVDKIGKNVDKVSVDDKVQDFNSVLDDVENLLNSTDDDENEINLDVSRNTNDIMKDLDDVINN